jgi:hypothetical protein
MMVLMAIQKSKDMLSSEMDILSHEINILSRAMGILSFPTCISTNL